MRGLIILFLTLSLPLSAEKKILAFAGSTREHSFNKKLVAEAAKIAERLGATVTLIDLKDFQMPFYDADLEKQGMPPQAKRLRDLMVASDGIIISTPEYNASVSGILKNALDWASRKDGEASRSAFKGKKFALMSAAPGKNGAKRALANLKEIIEDCGGVIVPIQLSISNANQAFDAMGLKESPAKEQLVNEIKSLVF